MLRLLGLLGLLGLLILGVVLVVLANTVVIPLGLNPATLIVGIVLVAGSLLKGAWDLLRPSEEPSN